MIQILVGRYGPETPGMEMGPTLALATAEANGAFEYLSFMNKRVQIQTVKNFFMQMVPSRSEETGQNVSHIGNEFKKN